MLKEHLLGENLIKMTHKHLTDLFTPEEIRDAREEAIHRFPNHNMDALMETAFSEYICYEHESIMNKESKKEIFRRLKEMVELGYSPNCIRYYEQSYHLLKEEHSKNDY